MKKITLLIVSIVILAAQINAKWTEELFRVKPTGLSYKQTAAVEKALEGILSYKIPQVGDGVDPRDVADSIPDMTAHLFPTLVISSATALASNTEQPQFVYTFLYQGISSFKELLTYVVTSKKPLRFLAHFKAIYNAHAKNRENLAIILKNEIEACNFAKGSFERKELNAKNREGISQLIDIEKEQLVALKRFLESITDSEAVCMAELNSLNDQKISTLRIITPFLILAAAGGAAYLHQQYGDYIAQLATNTYNAAAQIAANNTPASMHDLAAIISGAGSTAMEKASSAWTSSGEYLSGMAGSMAEKGEKVLSGAAGYLPSMPTMQSAKALVAQIPSMFTKENAQAFFSSAADKAMSFGWNVVSGTALGYAGYKGAEAYRGMKQKATNEDGDEEDDIFEGKKK